MSKLYLRGRSDARKTPIKSRGHKYIDLELFYGSAGDSRLMVSVRMNIPDDTGKATLWIDGNKAKEFYMPDSIEFVNKKKRGK